MIFNWKRGNGKQTTISEIEFSINRLYFLLGQQNLLNGEKCWNGFEAGETST